MDPKMYDSAGAEHLEEKRVEVPLAKVPHGKLTQVNAASVALAAAVVAQKPSLWSKNMLK